MTGPFDKSDDDPFGGSDPFKNGAQGGALDEFENHDILIVPREFTPEGFKPPNQDKAIDVIRADVYSFAGEDVTVTEGVGIFSKALVGSMKASARFNEKYGVQENGFPKMTIGHLFKDEEKKQRGMSTPWGLRPIKDEAVISRMRKYAIDNLKDVQNPFGS